MEAFLQRIEPLNIKQFKGLPLWWAIVLTPQAAVQNPRAPSENCSVKAQLGESCAQRYLVSEIEVLKHSAWVQIPTLSLTTYMISGKCFTSLCLSFLVSEMWIINVPILERYSGHKNELVYVNHLEQWLTYRECSVSSLNLMSGNLKKQYTMNT